MILGGEGAGRDFKLTISTKIKKVYSVKMLRHIVFHKRCLVIYNKSGLKYLKLSALNGPRLPPRQGDVNNNSGQIYKYITIFSFFTKSLQRTRTPHILIYSLNIVINLYQALAWVFICIFSSSF